MLWYQDVFDRECPRQIEVKGQGLKQGLAELWARHLFETVGVSGQKGFSRFDLWWEEQQKSITVIGDWNGMVRLRSWIFGGKQTARKGYLQDGDTRLIMQVARIHSRLILAGQTSEPILTLAANLDKRAKFERQLLELPIDDQE